MSWLGWRPKRSVCVVRGLVKNIPLSICAQKVAFSERRENGFPGVNVIIFGDYSEKQKVVAQARCMRFSLKQLRYVTE